MPPRRPFWLEVLWVGSGDAAPPESQAPAEPCSLLVEAPVPTSQQPWPRRGATQLPREPQPLLPRGDAHWETWPWPWRPLSWEPHPCSHWPLRVDEALSQLGLPGSPQATGFAWEVTVSPT